MLGMDRSQADNTTKRLNLDKCVLHFQLKEMIRCVSVKKEKVKNLETGIWKKDGVSSKAGLDSLDQSLGKMTTRPCGSR